MAASVTTCGGVTAPERTQRMPPSPQSRPRCHPRDSSRADRRPGAAITSRPNPSSLRHHASSRPSGDHANDRCPGPHAGSACSRCSARTDLAFAPSASATVSTGQPVASQMYASCEPSGENRGWPTATASPPNVLTAPSSLRIAIRDASHGMSGRSHSCHASVAPSGDHDASHAKSACDTRTGHSEPSSGTIATSSASARSSVNATSPRADTAGAAAWPSRLRTARRSAGDREREQAAVAGRDDHLVGPGPAPPAGHWAVGGDHDRRGRPVGRCDHEVGTPVEAVDPAQAGPVRRPPGIRDAVRAGDHRRRDAGRHRADASSAASTSFKRLRPFGPPASA